LPYLDGRFDVEEGDYNPAERLQWRPGVNLAMLVDRFADLCEGGDVEDLWREEVLRMLARLQGYSRSDLL